MSRRRRKDTEVSLFPFLSVLACVIGTLVLLLSAIAVGGMGERSLDQVRLSERFEAAQIFIAGGRALLEEYEAQLQLREDAAKDDQKLGRQLSGLGLNPNISLDELKALVQVEQEFADVSEEGRRLAAQSEELAASTLRSNDKLGELGAARLRAPILIDPSGIGPNYRPYLVECTAEYLELHRTKGDFSFRIPTIEISRSPQYKKFLRRVRAISKGLVIFMIRPEGVKTFKSAEAVAHQFKVRNAKLPLPGQGKLDFGLMQEVAQ